MVKVVFISSKCVYCIIFIFAAIHVFCVDKRQLTSVVA